MVSDSESVIGKRKGVVWAAATVALFVCCSLSGAPPGRLAGEVDARGIAQILSRHHGRVVLLNFWATWCEPCREEYPDLVRLQKELGPRGLQIVGVSTDVSSAIPAAEKFLTEQKPGFPNYHKRGGGDDQNFINAVDKNWGGELPFSVLYDRTGKKARTLSGKHSRAEYQQEILPLLK